MNQLRGIPLLVYVGPTITARQVVAILPSAQIRPPISRGDLYRDRALGYSAFVVIDGLFHQHEAIALREIVDVLRDGAWVVGASSMGALRAAECWPAGMQGIGSIYRLFRRGSLGSDDEVAVSFNPDDPQQSSVALINVRHAVSRATRSGRIDALIGKRLVAAAVDTYYPDRYWGDLLHRAGVDDADRRLEGVLGGYDLKRDDALTAFRRVAGRLAETPALAYQARRSAEPLVPTKTYRERAHSALDGLSADMVRPALAKFVLAAGRHHQIGVECVGQEFIDPPSDIAERIWSALARSGDLDAEIYRLRAVQGAPEEAQKAGLSPQPVHREMAALEIARGHGCDSWSKLEKKFARTPILWSWVIGHREDLAWANCLRAALFARGAASSSSSAMPTTG
jgi:hypothetical protein